MPVKYTHDANTGFPTPIYTGEGNEVVTTDIIHQLTHDGYVYLCCLLDRAVLNTEFLSMSIDVDPGVGDFHVLFTVAAGGDSVMLFHEAPILTSGGPLVAYNRNRNSANLVNATMLSNPVIMTSGTILCNRLIPGGTAFAMGGSVADEGGWVLVGGETYLIQVENISGNTVPISITLTLVENEGAVPEFSGAITTGTQPVSILQGG